MQPMAVSNGELARRGYEALVRGDMDAVREFLDPDVKWHAGDATAEGTCQNREQALQWMRAARLRGRVGELVDVIDAGDRVVVIMRPEGGDGRRDGRAANVTTFRDGRAIEIVHYPDPQDALAAAGLVSG
jgi:ketosteroid isomerase-like protein